MARNSLEWCFLTLSTEELPPRMVRDADSEFIVQVLDAPGNVPDGEVLLALVVNLKGWATLLKLRSPNFSWANAV